jgi:hypothetical protein
MGYGINVTCIRNNDRVPPELIERIHLSLLPFPRTLTIASNPLLAKKYRLVPGLRLPSDETTFWILAAGSA